MDRTIGGVFGLAAFVAVIGISLSKGHSFTVAVVRAILAMVLGYLVGRLIFGWPGLSIVREAAGTVPPPPPAPGDSEPVGAPPGPAASPAKVS